MCGSPAKPRAKAAQLLRPGGALAAVELTTGSCACDARTRREQEQQRRRSRLHAERGQSEDAALRAHRAPHFLLAELPPQRLRGRVAQPGREAPRPRMVREASRSQRSRCRGKVLWPRQRIPPQGAAVVSKPSERARSARTHRIRGRRPQQVGRSAPGHAIRVMASPPADRSRVRTSKQRVEQSVRRGRGISQLTAVGCPSPKRKKQSATVLMLDPEYKNNRTIAGCLAQILAETRNKSLRTPGTLSPRVPSGYTWMVRSHRWATSSKLSGHVP
eukprot:131684-Prymnesium_polylepis.1